MKKKFADRRNAKTASNSTGLWLNGQMDHALSFTLKESPSYHLLCFQDSQGINSSRIKLISVNWELL